MHSFAKFSWRQRMAFTVGEPIESASSLATTAWSMHSPETTYQQNPRTSGNSFDQGFSSFGTDSRRMFIGPGADVLGQSPTCATRKLQDSRCLFFLHDFPEEHIMLALVEKQLTRSIHDRLTPGVTPFVSMTISMLHTACHHVVFRHRRHPTR